MFLKKVSGTRTHEVTLASILVFFSAWTIGPSTQIKSTRRWTLRRRHDQAIAKIIVPQPVFLAFQKVSGSIYRPNTLENKWFCIYGPTVRKKIVERQEIFSKRCNCSVAQLTLCVSPSPLHVQYFAFLQIASWLALAYMEMVNFSLGK